MKKQTAETTLWRSHFYIFLLEYESVTWMHFDFVYMFMVLHGKSANRCYIKHWSNIALLIIINRSIDRLAQRSFVYGCNFFTFRCVFRFYHFIYRLWSSLHFAILHIRDECINIDCLCIIFCYVFSKMRKKSRFTRMKTKIIKFPHFNTVDWVD